MLTPKELDHAARHLCESRGFAPDDRINRLNPEWEPASEPDIVDGVQTDVRALDAARHEIENYCQCEQAVQAALLHRRA